MEDPVTSCLEVEIHELKWPKTSKKFFHILTQYVWRCIKQHLNRFATYKARYSPWNSTWLQPKQRMRSLCNRRTTSYLHALVFIGKQLTARWRRYLAEEINIRRWMAQSVTVYLVRRHMSTDMTKIARHFVAVDTAPLRRDTDRQGLWL